MTTRNRCCRNRRATSFRAGGAELAGAGFLIAGLALAAALWSYDPNDPSWFNATSDAPRNWLGAGGAFLADPLLRTLGLAAWAPVVILTVWAVRLILHKGDERVWSRMILTVLTIPVTAMFASMHAPFEGWAFETGMGGIIGDGLLGAFLPLIPMSVGAVVTTVSLLLGVVFLLLGALNLGVVWSEARIAFRFLLRSLIAATVAIISATAVAAAYLWARGAEILAKPRSEKVAPPAPVGARRVEPGVDDVVEDDDDEPVDFDLDEPMMAFRERNERAEESDSILPAILRRNIEKTPVERPAAKPQKKSKQAQSEEQPMFALGDEAEEDVYEVPALSLLQHPSKIVRHQTSDAALEENARMLESVLDDYGVRGEIGSVRPGPVVTMYELEPAPGLKASRVIGLADDIARSMSALAARVSTIPGRNVIGIELPNDHREMVLLREQLSSGVYGDSNFKLALALGKDIGGEPVVANLAKMPHLLVAGTTGSGKSVAINTMILSLLYRLSPKECRLIMIDPKMLELSVYDGIPHLLSPVVTDPKKAVVALKWAVAEMEDRYRKMSKMGVRNIDGYNQRVRDALAKGEAFSRTIQTGFDEETGQPILETEEFAPEEMPYIVVIVDEMADLMMVAGKEIEA
ncbi:MAG: DNA translocase FtsK 4TM domain-containing protein, partial [Pseudomonadota bacterium]